MSTLTGLSDISLLVSLYPYVYITSHLHTLYWAEDCKLTVGAAYSAAPVHQPLEDAIDGGTAPAASLTPHTNGGVVC